MERWYRRRCLVDDPILEKLQAFADEFHSPGLTHERRLETSLDIKR